MTNEDAEGKLIVITGIKSIFQHDAYVLIDSEAEMFFVSTIFAYLADRVSSPLNWELVVRTPQGEEIVKGMVVVGCLCRRRNF